MCARSYECIWKKSAFFNKSRLNYIVELSRTRASFTGAILR